MLKEFVERVENACSWDEVIDVLNDVWENATGEEFEVVLERMLEKGKEML